MRQEIPDDVRNDPVAGPIAAGAEERMRAAAPNLADSLVARWRLAKGGDGKALELELAADGSEPPASTRTSIPLAPPPGRFDVGMFYHDALLDLLDARIDRRLRNYDKLVRQAEREAEIAAAAD